MKLKKSFKATLCSLTGIALLSAIGISAVACSDAQATTPLNNDSLNYKNLQPIQATGFFASNTGEYLLNVSYPNILIELKNTYANLQITNPDAQVISTSYNVGSPNAQNVYDQGTFNIKIKNAFENNDGLNVTIQNIINQFPLPIPPYPTKTTYDLTVDQVITNEILTNEEVLRLNVDEWKNFLLAGGFLPSNANLERTTNTLELISFKATGVGLLEDGSQKEYTITYNLTFQNSDNSQNTKSYQLTVSQMFGKTLNLTAFYLKTDLEIFNGINTALVAIKEQPLEQNQILNASNKFNNFSIQTVANTIIINFSSTTNFNYEVLISGFFQ